jgi:hypothetical protein
MIMFMLYIYIVFFNFVGSSGPESCSFFFIKKE